MKFSTLAAVISATATIAAAQPHRHAHHHLHKREAVIIYELNGRVIPAAEVEEGIANGTLVWGPTGGATQPVKLNVAPAASAPANTPAKAPIVSNKLAVTDNDAPTTAVGATTPFPDGELSCSTFPSQYGALAVPWVGLGGWTGIQQPGSAIGGFDAIKTLTSELCVGGNCCSEGSFCSYACAPGLQKTQWPEMQGLTGQSVGGLLCKNGKLSLTNSAFNTLCMKGSSAVNVQIKNTMSKGAAVCRTDYPGTEGETIPLNAAPGTTTPLTTPDGDDYYHWKGGVTSAQYYVNPAGVSVEQACQWGSAANPWGNFAPMNIGAGFSNGAAYLSIFQNLPTTSQKLDYTVELVGNNGGFDNLEGRCKYSNGQYCSGNNYENCSADGKGCTVAVKSGTATFVFSS